MFKTILLPVDVAHLDEGHKTLEVALAIMSPDTSIILLYVMEDIPNWTEIDLPPDFKENSMQSARQALESIAKTTDKAVQVEVRAGHAYSTILKEAEAANVDLIILASHKPGLKEYFIGSNTSKVVSHASCSVVVVR
jgi:nucleotide-binding universal stress UspA family protein